MRTLHKYHPPLQLTNDAGLPFFGIKTTVQGALLEGMTGWVQPFSGQNVYVHQNYFDLKGLAVEDKTLFIEAAAVQTAGFSSFLNGAAGDHYYAWDIMTAISIDWTTVDFNEFQYNGAGFPAGPLNFEHVLYQRLTRIGLDVDNSAFASIKTLDEQSGSLEATASDRIYCHRIIILVPESPSPGPPVSGLTEVILPPVRYVIQAEAREEKDYQYLMRLKKSYDLQNEPDVERT